MTPKSNPISTSDLARYFIYTITLLIGGAELLLGIAGVILFTPFLEYASKKISYIGDLITIAMGLLYGIPFFLVLKRKTTSKFGFIILIVLIGINLLAFVLMAKYLNASNIKAPPGT